MPSGIPLGPYVLKRKLARGGMAEIFLARKEGPEGFARDLVVKRMLPHLTADPELSALFRAEARIVAQMNHANVVHVYDFGEEGGTGYLVMELVRGVDLRALTERAAVVARRSGRRGAVPARHAAKLLSFVCEGLSHAHGLRGDDGRRLGVVHQDITPSNVLVSFDGAVKVADFGVAKLAGGDGALRGKFAYLSPEQARGEQTDARSDLYNVGILLYETITGETLFPHNDAMKAKVLAAGGKVPRPERLKDLGAALEAVARKALSPKPEDRYQDALAMRADLENYLRHVDRPSDSVEIGRYVRALFPDVLAADKRGPRAAGTVATGNKSGTAPMTDLGEDGGGTPPMAMLDAVPTDPDAVPDAFTARLPTVEPVAKSKGPRRWAVPAALAFVALVLLVATVYLVTGPDDVRSEPLAPIPAALAMMNLETDPPGLVLYVDGTRMGEAPLRVEVPAGNHNVQARLGERIIAEQSLSLTSGEERDLRLAGEMDGTIRVESDPSGATVNIDDQPVGVSPFEGAFPPGPHAVTVVAEGYQEHAQEVALEPTETARVSVALRPLEAEAEVEVEQEARATMMTMRRVRGNGTLVVATNPWSAVFRGSRRLGITPLRVELPAGRHTLTLRAEGHPPRRVVVRIQEGQETRIRETL